MTGRYITPSALARGLGAAGHGTSHWLAQRISAIALVPLALWMAAALATGAATEHQTMTVWLKAPVNVVLMALLLLAAFYHASLGLQVVVEDYVHSRIRFVAIGIIQLTCVGGAAAGIAAALLIALAG